MFYCKPAHENLYNIYIYIHEKKIVIPIVIFAQLEVCIVYRAYILSHSLLNEEIIKKENSVYHLCLEIFW